MLWIILLLFALIKIPLFGFLLWLPFREDSQQEASPSVVSSEDDGGSKTPLISHRTRPPRRPRRGPHGQGSHRSRRPMRSERR